MISKSWQYKGFLRIVTTKSANSTRASRCRHEANVARSRGERATD
jgi:hypothetical protein